MVLGLRTAIYHVADLNRAKAWYSAAFGVAPYFDEPFYVGFNIGGYELGLDPDVSVSTPGVGGTVAYWGVEDIDQAVQHFAAHGAQVKAPIQDVGGGIKVATVSDPFDNLIGLIENPNFTLAAG
jgi:predicted enzyme related to lactoylglutathione lyase